MSNHRWWQVDEAFVGTASSPRWRLELIVTGTVVSTVAALLPLAEPVSCKTQQLEQNVTFQTGFQAVSQASLLAYHPKMKGLILL